MKRFLKSNDFNYAIVSNQKEFVDKKLNVSMYPTHFLVDKNGIIKKMVTNINELFMELKTSGIMSETAVTLEKIPPPPPPPLN